MKRNSGYLVRTGYREERRNQVAESAFSCVTDAFQVEERLGFDIIAQDVADHLEHQLVEITIAIGNRLQEVLRPGHLLLAGGVIDPQSRGRKIVRRVLSEVACVHFKSTVLENKDVGVHRKLVAYLSDAIF